MVQSQVLSTLDLMFQVNSGNVFIQIWNTANLAPQVL